MSPPTGWDLTRARLLADGLDALRAAGDRAAEEAGRRLDVLLRHPAGVSEGMLPVVAALLVDAGVVSGLVRSGIAARTQAAAVEDFRRHHAEGNPEGNPGEDDAEVERAARALGATTRMTLLARHLTAPQHTMAVLARTAELAGRHRDR